MRSRRNTSKYKVDERIFYNGHKATIIDVKDAGSYDYSYIIKFDQENMIPPQMEIGEAFLKKIRFGVHIDDEESKCPKCFEPWIISYGVYSKWFDCHKCNKTREKIEQELEEEKALAHLYGDYTQHF